MFPERDTLLLADTSFAFDLPFVTSLEAQAVLRVCITDI